jgi:5-hydroxyisourate hydrolase-like protein (transthyretin family)
MIKYILFFFGIIISLFLTNCKKKTTIDVIVYDYAMGEPVSNAVVVLVDRKETGVFSSNTSCKEVARANTDSEGRCSFNNEKLKTKSSVQYYVAIAEAYNKTQSYPCGGRTSGYVKVGSVQKTVLDAGSFDAFLKVQYNNLLNPSQAGDSLVITIANPKYQVPGEPYLYGGGGVFYALPTYTGLTPDPIIITSAVKTNAGKNTVHIRKRKMGVVTHTVDTIKIYPYETRLVPVNW